MSIGAVALGAGIIASVMGTAMIGTSMYQAKQQREMLSKQMKAQKEAQAANLALQEKAISMQSAAAEKAYALQENTAKQNEMLTNQQYAGTATTPVLSRTTPTSDAHYSGVGGVQEDDIFTQVAGLGGDNNLLGDTADQLF